MKNFARSVETFQISSDITVLFEFCDFPGMVGESNSCYRAYIITWDGLMKPEAPRELGYEELRLLYRDLHGYRERVRFWEIMRDHFSPEGVEARRQYEYESAMAIVR